MDYIYANDCLSDKTIQLRLCPLESAKTCSPLFAARNELSIIGFPPTSIHVLFSVLVDSLGIVLIFKKFGTVKTWMRITAILWLITLIFGMSFYVKYFVI
jgi:hypothetical protein